MSNVQLLAVVTKSIEQANQIMKGCVTNDAKFLENVRQINKLLQQANAAMNSIEQTIVTGYDSKINQ